MSGPPERPWDPNQIEREAAWVRRFEHLMKLMDANPAAPLIEIEIESMGLTREKVAEIRQAFDTYDAIQSELREQRATRKAEAIARMQREDAAYEERWSKAQACDGHAFGPLDVCDLCGWGASHEERTAYEHGWLHAERVAAAARRCDAPGIEKLIDEPHCAALVRALALDRRQAEALVAELRNAVVPGLVDDPTPGAAERALRRLERLAGALVANLRSNEPDAS